MTGKALVPIIARGGGIHTATLLEQDFHLEGETEVAEMEKKIPTVMVMAHLRWSPPLGRRGSLDVKGNSSRNRASIR